MTIVLQVLTVLIEILAVVALADFLSGFIHWIEDAYFTEDTPVIGPWFIRPNIVHHHLPRYFTKLSWWQSSKDLLFVGLLVIACAWWMNALTWHVWLFVVLGVNANQVHKWSHRTRAENGAVISLLQDIRVLQTPRHHGLHHTDPKNTYYCPITNLVNPLLEKISFWARLEALIERVTGIGHREDTAVRGQGPGPAWLADFRPAPRSAAVAVAAPTPPIASMTRAISLHTARPPAKRACNKDCARCAAKCRRGAAKV